MAIRGPRRLAVAATAIVVLLCWQCVASDSVLVRKAMARIGGAAYIDQGDVVRQTSAYDCGWAALAMIVVQHGRSASAVDDLHWLTTRRRAGLTFDELRAAAFRAALHARGVVGSVRTLESATLPAIVHFPGHYLVLDSIRTGDSFYLRDPAIGRIVMSRTAFIERWSGKMLLVERTPP